VNNDGNGMRATATTSTPPGTAPRPGPPPPTWSPSSGASWSPQDFSRLALTRPYP